MTETYTKNINKEGIETEKTQSRKIDKKKKKLNENRQKQTENRQKLIEIDRNNQISPDRERKRKI